MQCIHENEHDFLSGIQAYLSWCADLDPASSDWKSIQLLTLSNADVYAKRTLVQEDFEDSKMVKDWLSLLEANAFHFDSGEEAFYFLYYIERLVITSLQDFVINKWSKEELLNGDDFK